MLSLVIVILSLSALAYFAARPAFRAARTRKPEVDATPRSATSVPEPTTLEGALSGQLMRGEISRSHYRSVMQRLASRDDQEHPFVVPEAGDSGTAQ
ncbi:hypothetical protein [Actinoplanes palleronii]|uniref:SHOCT domain-containing protein n=1 Tax=Actinoplanes palleronii TaxID=113570 RepID=A0ABQ4BBX5_9ACTN|nr:hypothetical protein [Actinoplanes palleronii]GIE68166.1 hypothetical protein Apa02nite_042740 [Actinoplanes palleronii]